jgi:hypothetical protein
VLNIHSTVMGDFANVDRNLDWVDQCAEGVSHTAEVQASREIRRRFGAVQPEIALFWATRAMRCILCTLCKAA